MKFTWTALANSNERENDKCMNSKNVILAKRKDRTSTFLDEKKFEQTISYLCLFWFTFVVFSILFISFHLNRRISHSHARFFFLSVLFVWQVPKHSSALFSWYYCVNIMTKNIKKKTVTIRIVIMPIFSRKLSHRLQWCMQMNLNTIYDRKNDQINSICIITTEECTVRWNRDKDARDGRQQKSSQKKTTKTRNK